MLFAQHLIKEAEIIRPALTTLFDLANRHQQHPQDLFLVLNVGYHERALDGNKMGLSRYILGKPGTPGLMYGASFEFIHHYCSNNVVDLEAYKKYSKRKKAVERTNQIKLNERMSVQLELLIYMKIWESDLLLRELYQLVRLAKGECYNWDLNFDKKSRQDIIRNKIANRIRLLVPSLAHAIDEGYRPQIRNAAAHSLYYFIDTILQFTNARKPDDLNVLSIDQWCPFIHKTVVIFNELIGLKRQYDALYQQKAEDNNNLLEFRLPNGHPEPLRTIRYFPVQRRWGDIEIIDGQLGNSPPNT